MESYTLLPQLSSLVCNHSTCRSATCHVVPFSQFSSLVCNHSTSHSAGSHVVPFSQFSSLVCSHSTSHSATSDETQRELAMPERHETRWHVVQTVKRHIGHWP